MLKVFKLAICNIILWSMIHYIVSFSFLKIHDRLYFNGPFKLKSYTFDTYFWEKKCHVKRWKDHLPEGGKLFGSFNKSKLKNTSESGLEKFMVEINRAEMTHWAIMLSTPIVFIFNPKWARIIHVIYALFSNMPFIIVQRYNRPRFERLYKRRVNG